MPARRIAAKWVRNASDELAISQGCYFDVKAGRYVIDFVHQFCRQSKGRWAGQQLVLLPWQVDYLMRLFGWKNANGTRRFKRSYLEVGKKNGKTTLCSALAIFLVLADCEGAPEVYVNAVDREQASILYEEASRMVKASPELSKRLMVIDSKKRLIDPIGNGKFVANSADVASKDGINASAIIFDELHRQKTREMWDIFEYAGASREQPLTISITTAGESQDGVWWEQRDYSEKVNSGVIPDISHLGVVYRALETDDIDDPATWRKANPSLGVTISAEDFKRELQEAKEVPVKLSNLLRLRLNIVTRGDTAFCSLQQWDACRDVPIFAEGEPVFGGLDLSTLDDLTALAVIGGDADSGVDVEMYFWLPEDNIVELEKRHQVPYRHWADRGLITLTPGNVIDYSFIRSQINAIAQERGLQKLMVDPWNATKLALELKEQDGLPVEYIRQGYLSLTGPTKELLRLILSRQIRHGGNPILRWHASNAVAEQDAAGNIKLSKKKSARKIDGMSALVNALAGLTAGVTTQSVYETQPLLLL
jgi:phage terminase large subunit-like protein